MFRYTYPLDCPFLIRLQKEFYDLCFLKVPFFFIHLCVKVSPDGQYTRFLSGSCTKYSSFARFCIFFWCSINTATFYFLFCFIHNLPTHFHYYRWVCANNQRWCDRSASHFDRFAPKTRPFGCAMCRNNNFTIYGLYIDLVEVKEL